MSKNKNKPKKNAAADAPVEQEAGTTEVIVGPGAVVPVEAPVATVDAPVPADKTADTTDASSKDTTSEAYKDFTGIAATVPASASATEPAAIEPAPAPAPAATAPAATTPAATTPAATTPATETQPAEATPAPKTGFLNYIRSFFVDIGGAIHR